MENMTFGQAIEEVKNGKKLQGEDGTGRTSILNLRPVLDIKMPTGRSLTPIIKILGIERLHLSEHLAYSWGGLHHRQICWQMIGR